MDPHMMPQSEEELEQLVKLLESYEAGGHKGLGPIPEELHEMLANVKRAKGQQADAQQATQEVTPQPGYVIKTVVDKDRKVFINVCHSSQVPAPSSWAEGMAPEKVLKALQDMQQNQPNTDAEAMRFAISVSELLPDTDKQGQPCVTVDCMINSDIMKAVQQGRPFKAFVNDLVVGYVSEKHKLQLDPKYKLPKMPYKGTEIRPQRVKIDPKPLVSDITSTRDSDEPSFPLLPSKAAAKKAKAAGAAGAAAATSSSSSKAATASSTGAAVQGAAAGSSSSWHHEVKCEGRPVTHMVVSVQLPAPSTSSSTWLSDAVSVQLCGTQLRVAVDHKQQQQQQRQEGASQQQPSQQQQQGPSSVCIQLPFAATHAGAEAQLQRNSGQVVVQLPYLPVPQWVQQLQQEAPTAFSKLPVSHEAYMELDD